MRVLVTGATGFIGKYVVNELMYRDGIEVVPTGLPCKNIIRDFIEYKDCDIAIHLGWGNLDDYNNIEHATAIKNHIRFINMLVSNGLKRLICVGTCFEYGNNNGVLDESMHTNPSTLYGIAKDTLCKYISNIAESKNLDWKWLRLFYLYGEGQRSSSLIGQIDTAVKEGQTVFSMSKGEQLRDYLYVGTVAKRIVDMALHHGDSGVYNCCSGKPISVRRFVENYIKEKNYNIELLFNKPYRDYEPMAFWGDGRKLTEVLNEG